MQKRFLLSSEYLKALVIEAKISCVSWAVIVWKQQLLLRYCPYLFILRDSLAIPDILQPLFSNFGAKRNTHVIENNNILVCFWRTTTQVHAWNLVSFPTIIKECDFSCNWPSSWQLKTTSLHPLPTCYCKFTEININCRLSAHIQLLCLNLSM